MEVSSGGYIDDGMKLYVYYNDDDVIDTYTITRDHVDFSEDLVVDNLIISNISVNTTISSLKDNINTSGKLEFYDKKETCKLKRNCEEKNFLIV